MGLGKPDFVRNTKILQKMLTKTILAYITMRIVKTFLDGTTMKNMTMKE